ncbi:hypothetical protein [Alicyclobacillus fastidiosus]|uniref:HK97 gp10 family phage protein n=1 Tax=Alicyclobacillus fastidiosus TaxID=392011 RepID=A0ABV5ALD4_9BACL|nr:hypothetical protein [Alicyclobacillus fastidiosus]WEH08480.1 hypothetical protein PYS47_17560 [Alicyclobacillus fastidiosus]
MFAFRVEDDSLTSIIEGMADSAGNLMDALVRGVSETMTPYVKQHAPVGKRYLLDGTMIMGGELRDSLHFVYGQYGSYLAGARQGIWVIGGTKPHRIAPRGPRSVVSTRKQLPQFPHLSFFWPKVGTAVFPKAVNHPGTEPNDFRWEAFQQAMDEMAIQDVTNRIMTQWVSGGGI